MIRHSRSAAFALAAASLLGASAGRCAAPSGDLVVDEAALHEQQALSAAVEHVAPAVVQIRAIGGLDRVDGASLAQGPTTGLIVRADGYIVSSAFGFAQQPASVLVRLADGRQHPARIVGRDHNRMLVLLKVETDEPLPVTEATPLASIRPGQRVAAVGRTFVADRVNVSAGVVSATGRMNGRVLQTDAKVSAANYGGPLVDLTGRVMGVLAPMAPQMPGAAEEPSEVAGVEYYDSGIAFAVPLEHVLTILPRWLEEGDLRRGLLGIGFTKGSPHQTEPRIASVWPRSPAAEAGWQSKDLITAVDGVSVGSQTQLRNQIVPHYAGDRVAVTLQRGEGDSAQTIQSEVALAAKLPTYQQAFLGILPQREGAENETDERERPAGVVVRAVWPGSAAAEAGLAAGDVVTRIGEDSLASTADAVEALTAHAVGDELEVEFDRNGEALTRTLTAGELPANVLSKGDLPTAGAPPAADATAERPLVEIKLPEFPQTAAALSPEGGGAAPGLILWLGSGDAEANVRWLRSWTPTVDADRVAVVVATPGDAAGWTGGDLEYLAKLLRDSMKRFGADERRTIVGGEGKAGQLALALALKLRGQLAGVAAVSAPLPRTLEPPENAPGRTLAVLTIVAEKSPFSVLVSRDARRLAAAGYPVSESTRAAGAAAGQLSRESRSVIARWLDGLDRF